MGEKYLKVANLWRLEIGKDQPGEENEGKKKGTGLKKTILEKATIRMGRYSRLDCGT